MNSISDEQDLFMPYLLTRSYWVNEVHGYYWFQSGHLLAACLSFHITGDRIILGYPAKRALLAMCCMLPAWQVGPFWQDTIKLCPHGNFSHIWWIHFKFAVRPQCLWCVSGQFSQNLKIWFLQIYKNLQLHGSFVFGMIILLDLLI